ncbi:hypothetical protein LXA47_31360 [Massilia sp. P8910]|uniref:hypothetical protein n=1 Tax=Massilia antarctica TaxID=2765360 RepID=UPI001E4F03FD|nr:hypothetical protein [Massilia antarctica]MCE3608070.1 hypothetical protein [Massilia antarctica]
MDGAKLQLKVYKGYGQSAKRVGLPFDVYRSASMINPLDPTNKLATIPASFTTGMQYATFNKPGSPLWTALIDATTLLPGDWLVNGSQTFFIAEKQHLLPVAAVGCSCVVDIARAGYTTVGGGFGTGESLIAQALPVFMFAKKDKSAKPAYLGIATDSVVSLPEWEFYVNARTANDLRARDIIIGDQLDGQGQRCRYEIETLTLTSFGYILSAKLEKP